MEPEVTETDEKTKVKKVPSKPRFGRVIFLAKSGESESDLRARFDAKYSDGEEYSFEKSEKFANGAALVRSKFNEKRAAKAKTPERNVQPEGELADSDNTNNSSESYEETREKLDSERSEDWTSKEPLTKKKKKKTK